MKSKKLIIGLAVVIIVLIGTYFVGNNEALQGRFSLKSLNSDTVPALSLSTGSPSGVHTVSSSDTVLKFNLTTPKTGGTTLAIGTQFHVEFTTENDIDTTSNGITVRLKNDGRTVGAGELEVSSLAQNASETAHSWLELSEAVTIPAGSTEEFSVELDTGDMLAEDSGIDDPLYVDLTYYHQQAIDGNTLTY